ncbi:MAG TPA: hypothetical protein VGF79_12535 [Bacteroidia bacterium]
MHTKLLIRPVNFISRYQHWTQNRLIEFLEMFRGSYANAVFGKGAEDLQYIEDKAQNRLIWEPGVVSMDEMGFMIDYFKEVMLKNKYFNYLSDVRQDVFDNGIKLNVHRHYLKPDSAFHFNKEETEIQHFGNIFFEHHFNAKINSISISVNYYGQNQYASFEKLMELLLDDPNTIV